VSTDQKKIPAIVQLPGGRRLVALPFRIVAFHDSGAPKLFELLPPGASPSAQATGDDLRCALYADEAWIRTPNPALQAIAGTSRTDGDAP
jgi:hypothetical protein